MDDDKTPPLPSQKEWEVHWAFYRLTIKQRDAAWREVEVLKEETREQYKEIGEQAQIINDLQAELNEQEGSYQ